MNNILFCILFFGVFQLHAMKRAREEEPENKSPKRVQILPSHKGPEVQKPKLQTLEGDFVSNIEIVDISRNNDSGFAALRITREQYVDDVKFAYLIKRDERIIEMMEKELEEYDYDFDRWEEDYLKMRPPIGFTAQRIFSRLYNIVIKNYEFDSHRNMFIPSIGYVAVVDEGDNTKEQKLVAHVAFISYTNSGQLDHVVGLVVYGQQNPVSKQIRTSSEALKCHMNEVIKHYELDEAAAKLSSKCYNEIIKYYLENGADVNTSSDVNSSHPVDFFIESGDLVLVKYACSKDANLELPFGNFPNSLYYAVFLKQYEIAEYIVNFLRRAKSKDDLKNYINMSAEDGTTPLMYAAYYGPREFIYFLIEHGANIEAMNNLGHTAAHVAEWDWEDKKNFSYELSSALLAPSSRIRDVNKLKDSKGMLHNATTVYAAPNIYQKNNTYSDNGFFALRLSRERYISNLKYAYEQRINKRLMALMQIVIKASNLDTIDDWAEQYLENQPSLDIIHQRIIACLYGIVIKNYMVDTDGTMFVPYMISGQHIIDGTGNNIMQETPVVNLVYRSYGNKYEEMFDHFDALVVDNMPNPVPVYSR